MTGLPQAKKSLGQHWLSDEKVLANIADAAAIEAGDVVLEIGPGPGALTRELLTRHATVTAVEYDAQLAAQLTERFRGNANLEVVEQDILKFDLGRLPHPYKVVANIPYYLTSSLLRVLCESSNPFTRAALLIQKEVAERVAAQPGDMSLLSISVQFYCEVALGPVVAAELFTPPPKVDSQVLVLTYRGPAFTDVIEKDFFHLVKAGFSARRKKLRSSLSGGLRISKQEAEAMLQAAGINPDKRAQELSLNDWYLLSQTS